MGKRKGGRVLFKLVDMVGRGVKRMRKIFCLALVFVSIMGCLVTNAGAYEDVATDNRDLVEKEAVIMRASGSFNMSIGAYKRTVADKELPLEAGETVRIYATYSPDEASLDFGLIDPGGVFHYINVKTGCIDETIEIPERGNYTLAIRNNSGQTVQISGFVKY